VAADPLESPDDLQDAARAKSESMARPGEPGCAMHAENTPSGIAVIFTAEKSSSPDRVAAQARALAAELERERLEAAETEVEPSTFGTRQIAELAAQTFVTQTPDGARLTIDAKNSERVEALRARVLWQMARFMPDSRDTRGECPVVPRVAAERSER